MLTGQCHWFVMEIESSIKWQRIFAFKKSHLIKQRILFKDQFSLRALYLSEIVPWTQVLSTVIAAI